MQKQIKNTLFILIKTAVAFLSFFYIYLKLKEYGSKDFFMLFSEPKHLLLLSFIILLMSLNWFFESVKWKYLIRHLQTIPVFTAVKAVFSGITFAVFTPNRVGELGGRVFVLKRENRIKAVFSTTVGSLSQMLITVITGCMAGIILLYVFSHNIPYPFSEHLFLIKLVSLLIVAFCFLLFFNLKLVVKFLNNFRLSDKIINSMEIIAEYTFKELFTVLLFSFLRYIVFLFQFILLLYLFNVEIAIFEALVCISLTFFVSSVIPSFTLAEIGIRGSSALFFFGMFTEQHPGVISAVALLWIINLAIPAVIGAFFFYRTKL